MATWTEAARTIPAIFYIYDLGENNFIYCSGQMKDVLGYTLEEIQKVGSDALVSMMHPEDIDSVNHTLQRIATADDREVVQVQFRIRHANGPWRLLTGNAVVFTRAADGSVLQFLGTAVVITETEQDAIAHREQARTAQDFSTRLQTMLALTNSLSLAQSQDSLCFQAVQEGRTQLGFDRLAIWLAGEENEALGTWGTDENGGIRDEHNFRVNVSPRSLMGLAKTGQQRIVVKRNASLLNHKAEPIGQGDAAIAALWDGSRVIGCLCADNLLQSIPWSAQDSELLTLYADALGHLITRRQMTESLQESEARFRHIADSAPVMIFMTDIEGACNFVNQGFLDFIGAPVEMIFGYHWADFIHPDDRSKALENCIDAMRAQQLCRLEYRMKRADGTYRFLQAIGTPRYSSSGDYMGYIGSLVDITDIKAMQAQMAAAGKMESLGRLAGGIAHDFNNLLTVIIGFTELMEEQPTVIGELQDMLNNISMAAKRASELTKQLLMYARRQMVEFSSVDINQLVWEFKPLLQHALGEKYKLIETLAPGLPPARTNAGQIEQVLMNLVLNARDAMSNGGSIYLETSSVSLDEAYVASHVGVQPGNYILFSITDTGIGISRDLQERIFEPFFTTKEVGRGTGLGLATCYGIVKQSKGNIWVYSEPGMGATFKVYLPASIESQDTIPPPSEGFHSQGTKTILLVDDEPLIREIASSILRRRGYRVLEAKDGTDALQIQSEWKKPIDLLLTDVMMPLIGGKELADRIRQLQPATKVVFMSGYPQDVMVEEGVVNSDALFISKPFTASTLKQTIEEALSVNG